MKNGYNNEIGIKYISFLQPYWTKRFARECASVFIIIALYLQHTRLTRIPVRLFKYKFYISEVFYIDYSRRFAIWFNRV